VDNPIFSLANDRKLFEKFNKEFYRLYYHDVNFYLLNKRTGATDYIYHEDINYDIDSVPSFKIPAYVNVIDSGNVNLTKAGQDVDRKLNLYVSRKLLEETYVAVGLDIETDYPLDGDVVKLQDMFYEIIYCNYTSYHSNETKYPFDLAFLIIPWKRESINRPRARRL
jgi:hypothetical protein